MFVCCNLREIAMPMYSVELVTLSCLAIHFCHLYLFQWPGHAWNFQMASIFLFSQKNSTFDCMAIPLNIPLLIHRPFVWFSIARVPTGIWRWKLNFKCMGRSIVKQQASLIRCIHSEAFNQQLFCSPRRLLQEELWLIWQTSLLWAVPDVLSSLLGLPYTVGLVIMVLHRRTKLLLAKLAVH